MYRLIFILPLFIFLLCPGLPEMAHGQDRPIIVSGNIYSPPIMWKKSGKIVGIGPKLVNLILPNLAPNYEIRDQGNWQEVQELTKAGAIDLLVGAYRNNERQQYLLFSEPYFLEPVSIIIKKGHHLAFNSWDDLIGKKGVTPFGESYGQKFDNFLTAKLEIQRATIKKCFTMLLNEEVDYLLIDFFKGVNYSRMLRQGKQVRFLPRAVTVEKLHLAVAKSSPLAPKMPEIDARLKALVKDGTVAQLIAETNQEFAHSLQARERMFRRAKRDVAAAEGVDPLDQADFHQRYKEAIGQAIFLAP